MALAVLAGFVLATILPLSVVLEWRWGARYTTWVQAHGQVQVLGWVGLFILGMAYRMMPRFSGRPLPPPLAVWISWVSLVASLLLRLAVAHGNAGGWHDVGLISSGVLGVVAGVAFAVAVVSTLIHPHSRAGATGYFFVFGSIAFLIQSLVALALLALTVQRGESALRPLETAALLHLQFYGFIMMFMLGVALRAIPTFSGLPRPELSAKALAVTNAIVVGVYVAAALWVAFVASSDSVLRVEAAALAALGPVFLTAVWLSGIFRPAANRLRAASQSQIWFVRSALAWLVVAGGLAAYYGTDAAIEGPAVDYYAVDALRHVIGIGVASVMIVGMAILILPEFAIRRTQKRHEGLLPIAILGFLNVAAAVRVATAVAAPHWISPDRYWPMAVAGVLAWVAVILFALLFARSLSEKQALLDSMVPLRPAATP